LTPIVSYSTQRVLNVTRFQTKPNSKNCQNSQCPPFSTIQISHSMNIWNFWHSMNNTSIGPLTINCTQKNTGLRYNQRNCVLCKNSTQRKKLTYKIWSQRQCHITLCEKKEPNTKQRHCSCTTSKIFQCFCMSSIVQISNTQKQRRASNSVSLHCKNRPNNSNFILCKKSENNYTHMSNTTIRNNFFQINLSKCCQACIHNTNQTNSSNKRRKVSSCVREKINVKAQKSVSSKFQQNSSLQNTSRSASFNMSFRQPQMKWHQRNFYSKCLKESPPHKKLTTFRKTQMHKNFIMSSSSSSQQKQKHWQHCQTSN